MSIAQIKTGDLTFLVECDDRNLAQLPEGRCTVPTGVNGEKIVEMTEQIFTKAGMIASAIAGNVKKGLDSLDYFPEEVELELGFAITSAGKILIFSGETEAGIKLRMKWEK